MKGSGMRHFCIARRAPKPLTDDLSNGRHPPLPSPLANARKSPTKPLGPISRWLGGRIVTAVLTRVFVETQEPVDRTMSGAQPSHRLVNTNAESRCGK